MRTAREATLPLSLDRSSGETLPAQLVAGLRRLLASGVLAPGDELPSTRALAAHLGVARGTIMLAYDQLLAEGWFVAGAGRSTRVNPRLHEVHPPVGASDATAGRRSGRGAGQRGADHHTLASTPVDIVADLRPGRPWQGDVVRPQWRSAWRRAADQPLDVDVPSEGWPPLRAAISDHLRRMRALACPPERVVVTAGGREGLALLLRALAIRTIGVEEPGYPSLRRVPPLLGVPVVPLIADDEGLVTATLPGRAVPDAVLVTPSHQYPLGGSLPAGRRQELLAWARGHDVLVVEDDYDSELRYSTQPLPALATLDHADGNVVLLGTFSKTLSPALAAGFLVVPPRHLAAVAAARESLGQPVSLVAQRAMATYLDSGALDRHIQRMRSLYRRRRALVVEGLRGLPDVHVRPMDGGLHAVVEHEREEDAIVAALARRGVLVSPLSGYWSGTPTRRGLVFGFGAPEAPALERGVAEIRAVLSS